MRILNFALIAILVMVYLIEFGDGDVGGHFLFALPLLVTPSMMTVTLAIKWKSVLAQAVLMVATLAHAGWFYYLFTMKGGMAVLSGGISAIPVLCILWWIRYAVEWESRARIVDVKRVEDSPTRMGRKTSHD